MGADIVQAEREIRGIAVTVPRVLAAFWVATVVSLALALPAMAQGAVARADIGASILDDGSLVVTDERVFVLTEEVTFVAWEIPTYGVSDIEVLGFEGPGGVYRRVGVAFEGGRSLWGTYTVESTDDYLLVSAWFRPRDGRETFTVWYRVPDAVTAWQGSAGIYGRLSASTQADGVRGVRLVYSEQVDIPQEPVTNPLLARVQPWLEEPPEVVERFSTWFALLVALFVFVTLVLVVWRRRRWYATSFVGSPIAQVPQGLSPALAGALLSGRSGYRAGIAATMIDLLDRDIVTVTRSQSGAHRLRLSIDRTQKLTPERHERVVRRVVFFWLGWLGSYAVPTTLRRADRLKAFAVGALGRVMFSSAVRGQLQDLGLASRFTVGRVVLVITMGVLVVAAGVPALVLAGALPVFALNSLIGVAVPFVWLLPLRLTSAGVDQRNTYGTFRMCLADADCAAQLEPLSPEEWHRVFALAIAFGCEDSLGPAVATRADAGDSETPSFVAVADALAPGRSR